MGTAVQRYGDVVRFEQEAAALGVVKAVQDALNARDPEALGAHFSAQAVWTDGSGRTLVGRKQIAESGWRTGGQYARHDVVGVTEIGPDVLAVRIAQTPVDKAGREIEGARGAPLYVIAREPGGWKIVAGQNALLANPARG